VSNDVQPTGDGEDADAVDVNLVRRLQLRVKELEWERLALQSEIESKQTNNNIDFSSASDEQPSKEDFDAVKVPSP